MLEIKVLVFELLAVDGLAAGAILVGEIATLAQQRQVEGWRGGGVAGWLGGGVAGWEGAKAKRVELQG